MSDQGPLMLRWLVFLVMGLSLLVIAVVAYVLMSERIVPESGGSQRPVDPSKPLNNLDQGRSEPHVREKSTGNRSVSAARGGNATSVETPLSAPMTDSESQDPGLSALGMGDSGQKQDFFCDLARQEREACEALPRSPEALEFCLKANGYYTNSRHCGYRP